MKTFASCFFVTLISGLFACGNLIADTITLTGLPSGDVDTISIQLNPGIGAVDGVVGATVGWGFSVDWTSTQGDWISFTSSSLGSVAQGETNPGLSGGYTDFIGAQGGPVDFGLSPGLWVEGFDGLSQGVGSYQITTDPGNAAPGAEDTGQITFNFQVYNGDPLTDGVQIGEDSYSYYGSATQFSVTVDPSPAPEPTTFGLLLAGASILAAANWRRKLCALRSESRI